MGRGGGAGEEEEPRFSSVYHWKKNLRLVYKVTATCMGVCVCVCVCMSVCVCLSVCVAAVHVCGRPPQSGILRPDSFPMPLSK